MTNAEGEDVVAGVRDPLPVSQLKNDLPDVYEKLMAAQQKLEKHYRDMQVWEGLDPFPSNQMYLVLRLPISSTYVTAATLSFPLLTYCSSPLPLACLLPCFDPLGH